jgi:single-strand DNA-binding protein
MAQVSFRANVGKVRGLQFSQDGKPRFSFSAAESHRRLNKQSQQWEDTGTTWYNVTVFGRHAEDCADIIQENAKQQVVVHGRMETREYEHNGEHRSSLDVVADQVGLIHRAPQQGQGSQQGHWIGQQQPQASPAANAWGDQSQTSVWAGGGTPQGGPVPF